MGKVNQMGTVNLSN